MGHWREWSWQAAGGAAEAGEGAALISKHRSSAGHVCSGIQRLWRSGEGASKGEEGESRDRQGGANFDFVKNASLRLHQKQACEPLEALESGTGAAGPDGKEQVTCSHIVSCCFETCSLSLSLSLSLSVAYQEMECRQHVQDSAGLTFPACIQQAVLQALHGSHGPLCFFRSTCIL